MTSSADPRRPAAATATGPRRRVAGSRRRGQATGHHTLTVAEAPLETVDEADVHADAPDVPADPRTDAVRDAAPGRLRTVFGAGHRRPPAAAPTDARSDADAQTGAGARPAGDAKGRAGLWSSALASGLALALLAAVLVVVLRPAPGDVDRTAAVGSARTTLESLLSYSGTKFDEHVTEVTPRLTAPFRDQFAKVAATDIKPMAVKNGATVQAKVYEAGVMDVAGDGSEGTTVRVLAFVNQATTTTAQKTPAIDQNRVVATMKRVGDRWLVSDLAAF